EAPEAVLARLADVLGPPADRDDLAVRAEDVAELRRDDRLVAAADDRLADEPLVLAHAVHIGGVEQRHAEIERVADRPNRLPLVDVAAVVGREAEAAEADGRDGEAAPAQLTAL